MSKSNGGWIALFSGGKDSSWALYRALETGRDVRRLVTVHPPEDSHMYHMPAASAARLAAQSVGIPIVDARIPIVDMEPPDIGGDSARSPGAQDDAAIEPLESTLQTLDSDLEGGVSGVVAGTVDSEFRVDRVQAMCDRLGCDVFAPLWQADPCRVARTMIDAGLEIVVTEVAAPGFDASWLGRQLDRDALADLEDLHRDYSVHLLGEGGEFETIVTDGPHMACPIALDFQREWYGTWGRVRITDARLETSASENDHRC